METFAVTVVPVAKPDEWRAWVDSIASWSLCVTLVFRHEGAEWQLVRRHADPLVHAISMEHMAALARGQS